MLTLMDINAATNSKDGDIYSDLYKDVYGSRPRYARFESVRDFDQDFNRLSKMLDEQLADQKVQQARNFENFVCRVDGIMQMVHGCDRERAIKIICEAEGIDEEEFNFYGLESLEYKFDLKYGSIAKWLSE